MNKAEVTTMNYTAAFEELMDWLDNLEDEEVVIDKDFEELIESI